MKKFMFILAIISYALFAHASVNINNPSIKKDSIGVNKKLNDLNSKLADLNAQLTKIQNQLPVDSAKYQDCWPNHSMRKIKVKMLPRRGWRKCE